MSLVGTRPPTVDEWDKYELHHRARLATKPGLTDKELIRRGDILISLATGSINEAEQWCAYELYYGDVS